MDTGLSGLGHRFPSSVPYNHLFVTTSVFLQTLESTVSHQTFYSLGQEEIPAKGKLKYFSVPLRGKKGLQKNTVSTISWLVFHNLSVTPPYSMLVSKFHGVKQAETCLPVL